MEGSWHFLSNHGLVLLCVARDPGSRLRDIAASVGITERSAHSIVADLVAASYLTKRREGNRNHYEIRPGLSMRHPLVEDRSIGEILAAIAPELPSERSGPPGA